MVVLILPGETMEKVDDTQADIDSASDFAAAFDDDAVVGADAGSDEAGLPDELDDVVAPDAGDSADYAPAKVGDDSSGSENAQGSEFDPAKIQAQLSSMSGRLSASDKRANDLERQASELQAENERLKKAQARRVVADEDDSPDFDDDQQDSQHRGSALDELEEDFPEIAAAIREASSRSDPRLDDFSKWQQEQSMQKHLGEIAQAHPDFQEVAQSNELDQWINQQPSFLRDGYQQVRASGTSDQVIEMLNQYKGGNGRLVNNSGSRRVAVKSGRSFIPGARADKDDFAGGWSDGE